MSLCTVLLSCKLVHCLTDVLEDEQLKVPLYSHKLNTTPINFYLMANLKEIKDCLKAVKREALGRVWQHC